MSTEVQTVTIKSAEQAVAMLQAALDGKFKDDESILIRFEGWPKFAVNVKGERYSSTLPTQLMKALVDYQHSFNKFYAHSVYGRSAKSFTDEDRSFNELVFNVKEGSSDIWAQLSERFSGLAERMVDRMTGKQLVITVLGLALISAGYFGYKNYLDNDAATAQEKGRLELEKKLVDANDSARRASEEFAANAMDIVRSVSDAKSVDIGTQHFKKADIEAISQKSRQAWPRKRIDGNYKVVSLKKLKDRWTIQLVAEGSDQIIRTELFRAEKGAEAIQELSGAFANDKPLKLYIIAGVNGDQISQARILGTEKTGFGVANTAGAEDDAFADNDD